MPQPVRASAHPSDMQHFYGIIQGGAVHRCELHSGAVAFRDGGQQAGVMGRRVVSAAMFFNVNQSMANKDTFY